MTRVIRFSDLNYEEKAKLTDEQIKEFIRIECAYKGIKLLTFQPEEPVKLSLGEKTDYFRIGYNSEMTFLKLEDAEKVLKLLRSCDMVTSNYDENYPYVSKIRKFDEGISTTSCYTAEQHKVIEEDLKFYNKLKDEYEILYKEWNKIDIEVSKIHDEIYEQMQKIQKLEHTKGMVISDYRIYLKMAKGDNEIAFKFLENSWSAELSKLEKGMGKERYKGFCKGLNMMK